MVRDRLPEFRNTRRVVVVVLVAATLIVVVWTPWLPRAPDLYAHLLWGWQVMRCLAEGQLPLWLPDLNAGFGSPGIRLYSPLGPMLSGGLGLLLGDIGRGLRAAAVVSALGVLIVGFARSRQSEILKPWVGCAVLLSPMVLFSLFGRTAWSEFLAIPLMWWMLEKWVAGRVEPCTEGLLIAGLWLVHAPTALMVGCLAAASTMLHRSRRFTISLVCAAFVGAGLTAWHWLPMITEGRLIDRGPDLTTGIFDPARNLLGSSQAHDLDASIWLGLVAVCVLVSLLVSRLWRADRDRTVLIVLCVAMASPAALLLWQLETPLRWLQFPWRWLLPATALAVAGVGDHRRRRAAALACLLVPSLLLPWAGWVRFPLRDQHVSWNQMGQTILSTLGGNPMLVDVPENRPPAFSQLATNLGSFGSHQKVVVSDHGRLISIDRWSPLVRQIRVSGTEPFAVGMRLLAYPCWMLEVDGSNQAETGFMPGVVSCRLPPGQHTVRVAWVGNPLAAVGQIIAALTVAGLLVIWRRPKGRAA